MTDRLTSAEVEAFLRNHPEITGIDMLVPDTCGIFRGKRIGIDSIDKLFTEGVRLPGSTYLLDATGQNCDTIPYGSTDGDPDYPCFGIAGTLKKVPWARTGVGQIMATMYNDNGDPFFADPRHIVAKAAKPLSEMGLTPVIAIELEFYLLDKELDERGIARIARSSSMGRRQTMTQCYGIEELYEFEDFLADVEEACRIQGIPADTAVSEYGPGQYEVNLHHVANPIKACDDAVLLKRAIKGVARKHGLSASFMAKPFEDLAGCGLHVHLSLVDKDGRNFFAGPPDPETGIPMADTLRHAIGGLAETMADGMAIFAPNANSYRRFRPGSYAPINTAWGANNRTVSLRIPHCDEKSVRIEHRPAGADANPYLVVAAILAGVHHGIANRIDPGPMETEDAYARPQADLPRRWHAALDVFKESTILPEYLGQQYCETYANNRQFECDNFYSHVSPLDYEWYMRTV